MAPEVAGKVPDDCNVRKQEAEPDRSETDGELVDFERNENGGNDDDEVFGPTFAQHKADTFDEPKSGINEAAHAQLAQLLGGNRKHFGQDAVHVAVVWIHSEDVNPVQDGGGDVPVKIPQQADSNGKEDNCFKEFVSADQNEGDGGRRLEFGFWLRFQA